jgi:hypothetical protein
MAGRERMYELKAECLACLRSVEEYEYRGNFAGALKTLQAACESRRWTLEASMETEGGLAAWISALDAAVGSFQKATAPERGRDGSVMPEHPAQEKLRAHVDKELAGCKAKAEELKALVRARTGGDGTEFAALEAQMEHMRVLMEKYDAVVAHVRWAARQVRQGVQTFSRKAKTDIEEELEEALRCVDVMTTVADLRREIEYAQGLVRTTAAYVAPRVEKVAKVEEAKKPQAEGGFTPVHSEWQDRGGEGGYARHWVEIRLYGDRYERWVDGEYETTMTAETVRLLYPNTAVAQADLTQTQAHIGTLLCRMKTLA